MKFEGKFFDSIFLKNSDKFRESWISAVFCP